jgi:hypothetical protein
VAVGTEKTVSVSETKCVGDKSGEGTPGTISNPAVKVTSADGTARAASWESTPLPTLFFK